MRRKADCWNCRALREHVGPTGFVQYGCDLRYPMYVKKIVTEVKVRRPCPSLPCPKPRTYRQYDNAEPYKPSKALLKGEGDA